MTLKVLHPLHLFPRPPRILIAHLSHLLMVLALQLIDHLLVTLLLLQCALLGLHQSLFLKSQTPCEHLLQVMHISYLSALQLSEYFLGLTLLLQF